MSRIDYFYSISSPWAYLGTDRLKALADAHNLTIEPHLITIVEENGAIPVRTRPEARRAYFYKEVKRWSELLDRPVVLENRPTTDWVPASFMVVAAYLDGLDWFALTRALQFAWWQEPADIGQPAVRAEIADRAGFDGAALLARESGDDVAARWAADRQLAVSRGVFGVPTYIYDGELYWGQDRLSFVENAILGNAKATPAA